MSRFISRSDWRDAVRVAFNLVKGVVANVQVTVGRLSANVMTVSDNEVSGHHVAIRWDPSCRCWQVQMLPCTCLYHVLLLCYTW